MVTLSYSDQLQIVKPKLASDGYGTEVIDSVNDVDGLFIADTGYAHGGHQSSVISHAQVYVDPENDFILNNYLRLEGMYVIANPFGDPETQAWYKIIDVVIGQDKLLENEVNNILCTLKKSSEIHYVS